MDQLGTYVVAALVLGVAVGFPIGRLSRRLSHRVDVKVVGMGPIDRVHSPDVREAVGLTVAVPKAALRRTRFGDTVSVFLR